MRITVKTGAITFSVVSLVCVLMACSGATTGAVAESSNPEDLQNSATEVTGDPQDLGAETGGQKSIEFIDPVEHAIDPRVVQAARDGLKEIDSNQLQLGDFGNVRGGGRVLTIPGPNIVQVLLDSGSTAFLVNVNTNGVVTDTKIKIERVIVESSQTYQNLFGATKSGWVLRSVNESKWSAAIELAAQEEQRERIRGIESEIAAIQAKVDALPFENWADVTGKFSTTAQFVDLIGQDLTLRMEEGKTINLKLDRLDDNGRAKASSRAYDMGRWKMQRAKLEKQLAQ